jgi:rubrerythrin
MIRPRFDRTAQKAAEALISHHIKRLPVNPLEMIKQHKNWRTMTYYELGAHNGIPEEDVIRLVGSSDGCAFYQAEQDRYLILYNTNVLWLDSTRRMTWTLAHEAGHILLGHLSETHEAMIARSSLDEAKYQQLEAEAEYFAANVLAPDPVLFRLGLSMASQIMDVCGISHAAAENKLKHLARRRKSRRLFKDDLIIDKQFHDFIYQKTCVICGHGLVSENAAFCPICGAQLGWGEGLMIYDGFEVDAKGRAFQCPQCGNEEIDEIGEYCKICGALIINRCADQIGYNEWGNSYVIQKSCQSAADGNARFCTNCGNPTTFFTQELLKSWEEAKAQIEAAATKDEWDDVLD